MTEAVYTLREAAETLRVPYRTLRDAVFQGRWPHVRISQRRRLMTDADIAAVLAMLHQAPSDPEAPSDPDSPSDRRQVRESVLDLLNGR